MKNILSILVLLVATVINASAHVNTVDNTTNVNQAIVSILGGVHSAGTELYNVSQEAIGNSINFVSQQAPDIMKQFLRWQLFSDLFYYSLWIMPIFLGFYGVYRFYQWSKREDDYDTYIVVKWIVRVISLIIFLIDTGCYGADALQILIAPKVYLLQYVLSQIHH